jgi:hypothetical protein
MVSPSIEEAVGDVVLPSLMTELAMPKQLSEWSKKPRTGEEEKVEVKEGEEKKLKKKCT